MQAIIQSGGRQFKVQKDQKLQVNKLAAEGEVTLPAVAMVSDDGKLTMGKGQVVAQVLRQLKGEKVVSATYKRRKGYHKKRGHRQQLTEIQITSIKG